jgi:hypothetical protein
MQNSTETPEALQKKWDARRELMLRFIPPIPTLAGVCLAGVSLISVHPRLDSRQTLLDDFLVFDALLFVTTFYLILWSVKSSSIHTALLLSRVVDVCLFVAIGVLVGVGFLLMYTHV